MQQWSRLLKPAKGLQMHNEFINGQGKKAYETNIGDRGGKLSGGHNVSESV